MRRRLSNQTSSKTASHPSISRASIAPSHSSLGRQNSSHSSWYISARNGVSTGRVTVMSPSRPLSVSGSMNGIRYFPSVSTTNASMGGPHRPQPFLGTSERNVSHFLCTPDAAGGVGGSSSSRIVQAATGPMPSADRLSSNRLSFSAGCHAFTRFSSKIVVTRVSPRSSHPTLSERKRIADSIRKQASAGRFSRLSKRTLLSGTEDLTAVGLASVQPCTSTAAPGASTTRLDIVPRIFASIDTTLGQQGKDIGAAPHSSSTDGVGKALFSGSGSLVPRERGTELQVAIENKTALAMPAVGAQTSRDKSVKDVGMLSDSQAVVLAKDQDARKLEPLGRNAVGAQEPKQEMAAIEFADTKAAQMSTDGQDVVPYEAQDALRREPDKKDVSEAQTPKQEMAAIEFTNTKAAQMSTGGQDVVPYEAQDTLRRQPDKKDVSEAQTPKQEMAAIEFAGTKAAQMSTDGQDVVPYEAQDALRREPDKKDVSEAQKPNEEMAAIEFTDTKAAQMSTDGQDLVPYEDQNALRPEPDENEVSEAQ